MNSRVFIYRILQFGDHEWQAVHEEDDIRPLVHTCSEQSRVVLDNRELVQYEEVVVVGIIEIDEPYKITPRLFAFSIRDIDPFGQHPVECFIVRDEVGRGEAKDLFYRVFTNIGFDLRIDTCYCFSESFEEEDIFERSPFGCFGIWGNVWAVDVVIGLVFEKLDREGFDGWEFAKRLHPLDKI